MLATGELELVFPGTCAPAFGDGPSLRRILVAVRAPGEAAEALAVAARVCRTIDSDQTPRGKATLKYGRRLILEAVHTSQSRGGPCRTGRNPGACSSGC